MTIDQAKELLKECTREELRDHAFGDCEVAWENAVGDVVASGYYGGGAQGNYVSFEDYTFSGQDVAELLTCGRLVIERNDETGPEEFSPGTIMPGLTLEGVRKELTTHPFVVVPADHKEGCIVQSISAGHCSSCNKPRSHAIHGELT